MAQAQVLRRGQLADSTGACVLLHSTMCRTYLRLIHAAKLDQRQRRAAILHRKPLCMRDDGLQGI